MRHSLGPPCPRARTLHGREGQDLSQAARGLACVAPGARLAALLVCAASAPKSLLKTLPRCLARPRLALAWRWGVPQALALPRHAWGSAVALRILGLRRPSGRRCGALPCAAGCCAPPRPFPGSFGHAPARRAAPRCRCPRPRRQGPHQSRSHMHMRLRCAAPGLCAASGRRECAKAALPLGCGGIGRSLAA